MARSRTCYLFYTVIHYIRPPLHLSAKRQDDLTKSPMRVKGLSAKKDKKDKTGGTLRIRVGRLLPRVGAGVLLAAAALWFTLRVRYVDEENLSSHPVRALRR